MKTFACLFLIACLGLPGLSAAEKNWAPPAGKIYAQTLVERIMAKHPELISVTLHGVPPDQSKVYTMFAGSYLDRIGNPDDPDDIMVTDKGITILDPRWHKPNDPVKKYVVQLPLRDDSGENVGLIVLAYHHEAGSKKGDREYLDAAMKLRDALERKIPSYAALFQPATEPSRE